MMLSVCPRIKVFFGEECGFFGYGVGFFYVKVYVLSEIISGSFFFYVYATLDLLPVISSFSLKRGSE